MLPFCASYVSEARHRAMFAQQLRDQLRAAGSARAPGPSSSASAFPDARMLTSDDSESYRTDSASQQDRTVADIDGTPAPMLADAVFVITCLPVVSVFMWHVTDRMVLWWDKP